MLSAGDGPIHVAPIVPAAAGGSAKGRSPAPSTPGAGHQVTASRTTPGGSSVGDAIVHGAASAYGTANNASNWLVGQAAHGLAAAGNDLIVKPLDNAFVQPFVNLYQGADKAYHGVNNLYHDLRNLFS
jgi:hypothetical protein